MLLTLIKLAVWITIIGVPFVTILVIETFKEKTILDKMPKLLADILFRIWQIVLLLIIISIMFLILIWHKVQIIV